MPSHSKTSQHANADVFTAIAHPVRRQILDQLRDEDTTVTHLATNFDISRPAISQHMAILLQSGLVNKRQEGRENFYQLQPERLQEVEIWVRHYQRFWKRKLGGLRNYLDTMPDDTPRGENEEHES